MYEYMVMNPKDYKLTKLIFTSLDWIPGVVDASEGAGRHFTAAVRFLSVKLVGEYGEGGVEGLLGLVNYLQASSYCWG